MDDQAWREKLEQERREKLERAGRDEILEKLGEYYKRKMSAEQWDAFRAAHDEAIGVRIDAGMSVEEIIADLGDDPRAPEWTPLVP